jgi:hypothetical protein
MDSLIYEGNTSSFHGISPQAVDAISGFADDEWHDFLVGVAVYEGSVGGGRPHGTVVIDVEGEAGLFVIDLTIFGGPAKLVCTRRGRKVLVARVVGRGRRVGKREVALAEDAVRDWRREQGRRRPDARRDR